MSIQSALEQAGVSREDFECIVKARNIIDNGNTAEIKRKSDGSMVVYEVKKAKR